MSITIVKDRKDGIAYYAVQVSGTDGTKRLCWSIGGHFFFAKKKGKSLPPALFATKKDVKYALDRIPKKKVKPSQFEELIDCKKVKVVKVYLDIE